MTTNRRRRRGPESPPRRRRRRRRELVVVSDLAAADEAAEVAVARSRPGRSVSRAEARAERGGRHVDVVAAAKGSTGVETDIKACPNGYGRRLVIGRRRRISDGQIGGQSRPANKRGANGQSRYNMLHFDSSLSAQINAAFICRFYVSIVCLATIKFYPPAPSRHISAKFRHRTHSSNILAGRDKPRKCSFLKEI